jgi:PfaD family protein
MSTDDVATSLLHDPLAIRQQAEQLDHKLIIRKQDQRLGLSQNYDPETTVAILPALTPGDLGDPGFRATYGLKANYMTGAMANGIASAELVIAAAEQGWLGSYGAAGQPIEVVQAAIAHIRAATPHATFAVNLIHSPSEPAHEESLVDLLLAEQVPVVEASAYLDLTAAAVRYRVKGLQQADDGSIVIPHRIIAKASRVEVASRWLSPPPQKLLDQLLSAGAITNAEATLAQRISMADDLIAEADSGGHTDNRPLVALLPTFINLRDRLQAKLQLPQPARVGAAGGLGTPQAVAGAFALGAAFVVTGSVNQACVESGSSDQARSMLAAAGQADTIMAPAADMFEMGVKLQVLKRGTMFPMRAGKLYELWRSYGTIEALPADERDKLEKQVFRRSLDDIWQETEAFWQAREPSVLNRVARDPKQKFALICRWYLGKSSRWANAGVSDRKVDYQIWAGPAIGAFNEWTADSHLAAAEQRTIAAVGANLLVGAALHLRLQGLMQAGLQVDQSIQPQEFSALSDWL